MDFLASENIWIVYLGLLIGPFMQQDLAVVGAAGISAASPHLTPIVAPLVFTGLMLSDLVKYFIGFYARRYKRLNDYAQHPKIAGASEKLRDHPGLALMASRFIPLTRMAAYVAAGFIRMPYHIYAGWAVLSGLIYIGLIFALFHMLGAVLGAQVKAYLPLIAIGAVVLIYAGLKICSKLTSRE